MESQIRSIVIGIAEIHEEDPLLAPTIRLADTLGAALHVVHAFQLPDSALPSTAGVSAFDPEVVRQLTEEVESRLTARVRQISGSTRIHCMAIPIAADRALLDVADEVGADLVVVGATRRGTLARTILGTTAQRVVRAASVPVLVSRRPGSAPPRRVILTTDLSEGSAMVYRRGVELVRMLAEGAEVELRALLVLAYEFAPPPPLSRGALADAAEAELDRFLERVEPGAPESRGTVRVGEPAKEIVAEAADWGADLLVVGTHGRSGPSRLLIGSVAEGVVRGALCDVLVIPNAAAFAEGGSADAEVSGREAVPPGSGSRQGRGRVRMQRVVSAVDFHESSWEAALWAMRFLAPDAEQELLHVVDLPELPGPLRGFAGQREQRRLAARDDGQRRLDELRELGARPHVATHVREGRPASQIVRLAEEVGADLVVVGEQGPTHGVAALLGSTAERVLFDAKVPVLVARKVPAAPPRRLLAAIDPAEVSHRILAWAGDLLGRFDGTLTVLNVVDRVLLFDELTSLPTAEDFQRMQEEAVAAMRVWLDEQLLAAGLPRPRVRAEVLLGDPSYEIGAEAARLEADLVLIGSKGGDIARTPVIGRIVNKVVRNAPCSVLVVTRGEPAEEA